jgi:hypothetical protein
LECAYEPDQLSAATTLRHRLYSSTVLFQFINLAKAMVEQMRPWMLLRYTDTSATVVAGNAWQTAIDLSGIARLSPFYGDRPIKLFDGANAI